MSTLISNSDHTVNPVNLNSEYKRRIKSYENFQKAAMIISTAAGMTSFIYSIIDVESITSLFFRNEETSAMVARLGVPLFSLLAGIALTSHYNKNTKI